MTPGIQSRRHAWTRSIVIGIAASVLATSLLAVGCHDQGDSQQAVVVTQENLAERTGDAKEEARPKVDAAAKAATSDEAPPNVDRPVTRADLERYMKVFSNERNWTFGERTPGELAGTWTPEDDSKASRVFNVDGVDGAYSETSFGLTVTGIYAVSENGKVVGVASGGGIFLGTHARLQDGVLVGPKGPNPNLTWRRHAPAPAGSRDCDALNRPLARGG